MSRLLLACHGILAFLYFHFLYWTGLPRKKNICYLYGRSAAQPECRLHPSTCSCFPGCRFSAFSVPCSWFPPRAAVCIARSPRSPARTAPPAEPPREPGALPPLAPSPKYRASLSTPISKAFAPLHPSASAPDASLTAPLNTHSTAAIFSSHEENEPLGCGQPINPAPFTKSPFLYLE